MFTVKYNDTTVDRQQLARYQTQSEPEVRISASDDAFYSVIMIDINAPPGKTYPNTSFLHWWVGNINLKNNFNQVWMDYFPPSPPKSTGKHQYIFYLYRQPAIIIRPEELNNVLGRAPFNLRYFVGKLGFELLGTTYFIIQS